MAKIKQITRLPVSRPKLVKVAAYARVSTSTCRQLSSISAQVSYYSRLIQSTPGWDYAGVFIDEGTTGTKIRGRQGLADLMALAHGGGVDIVLCKSISRLARNTVDLLQIVRDLKNLNVSIRFERENIDTSTNDGELLLTLLASFAQEESASLSANVKWAIRNRYKDGGTNSFFIYGYVWTQGKFVINHDEAQIVQRLFSNYLAGISPEKTANQLNSEGLRSRGGGVFHGSVLRRMLENERYKGCQLLQKTFNKTIRSTSRTPNDGVLTKYWVEQALPVIIEPALFDKVQQEIARRRQIGPAATPSLNTGVFTGRIRCGTCGRNYQRKTRRYASGNYYHYWRCWSACKGQGNPCGGHNLRETMLQSICATTLNLEEFDEHAVENHIVIIEAFPDHLMIHLRDARSIKIALDKQGRLT